MTTVREMHTAWKKVGNLRPPCPALPPPPPRSTLDPDCALTKTSAPHPLYQLSPAPLCSVVQAHPTTDAWPPTGDGRSARRDTISRADFQTELEAALQPLIDDRWLLAVSNTASGDDIPILHPLVPVSVGEKTWKKQEIQEDSKEQGAQREEKAQTQTKKEKRAQANTQLNEKQEKVKAEGKMRQDDEQEEEEELTAAAYVKAAGGTSASSSRMSEDL